ncbi:MAG: PQQ-binding-like beta-propeller repeat protein [Planctomycetota bacterium]
MHCCCSLFVRRWRAVARVALLAFTWHLLLERTTVGAGDWPQILGPERRGVARDERLAITWPREGLTPTWTYPLGQGYAGPAVAGNRVLVFHRVEGVERLEALDRVTGKPLWKTDFATNYRSGIDPDSGPRAVPLVHDDQVYVWGVEGELRSVALADGKLRWSRSLGRELRAEEGYFGAGSTPLIVADKLLVNVGGKNEGGIVAVDPQTGKTLWQATDEGASYSAPTSARVQGKQAAIFVTRLNCVAVAADSGTVLFRIPFGKRGPTVNAATPLVDEQRLFLSASYGIGAQLYQLDQPKPRQIWGNDETLSSQYATAVWHRGHLYGTHGREDAAAEGRAAELRCVAAESGAVRWSVPDFGVAHVIQADDYLLVVQVRGSVLLAKASPERLEKLSSATVTKPGEVTRALPALAHGQLILRTNSGRDGGRLLSLPVGEP